MGLRVKKEGNHVNGKKKWLSMLVASSFLLVSCGTPDSGTAGTTSTDPIESSSEALDSSSVSSMSSMSSEELEESSSIVRSSTESFSIEKSESKVESNMEEVESEATSSESESVDYAERNDEEAMMVDRAKTKVTGLTGYTEGEGYLFLIDGIEGSQVNINVREDGEEVASSLGFYRYDDEVDSLQEMNIITGEYEDYPANE